MTRTEPSMRVVLRRTSGSWTRGMNAHSSVPRLGQMFVSVSVVPPVLAQTACSMPSVAPKYAMVGRVDVPASGLAGMTATVERSTPPSLAESTARTSVCQCVEVMPVTTLAGAISAPSVSALLSLNWTRAGWNDRPFASGVWVTVNRLRQLPSNVLQPELFADGILPDAPASNSTVPDENVVEVVVMLAVVRARMRPWRYGNEKLAMSDVDEIVFGVVLGFSNVPWTIAVSPLIVVTIDIARDVSFTGQVKPPPAMFCSEVS